MALCRPSTAADDADSSDSSDSSLSTPPDSVSGFSAEVVVEVKVPDEDVNHRGDLGPFDAIDEEPDERTKLALTVRPYLDRDNEFEYYDHVRGAKGKAVASQRASEEPESEDPKVSEDLQEPEDVSSKDKPKDTKNAKPSKERFPFPKFTPIENFENYFTDCMDMPYEELYHRTSVVTQTLLEYQREWDAIDKEIYDHEMFMKSEAMKTADLAKVVQAEKQAEEDVQLVVLQEEYEKEIILSRRVFEDWAENFATENPDKLEVLELLKKLRDTTFMKAFQKRQKAKKSQEVPVKSLIDKHIPEIKKTKDEIELEKRKRKRLLDAITFDDMNQADAYAFTWTASDLNRGRQPLPNHRVVPRPRGLTFGRRTTTRTRNKPAAYETEEQSETPTSDEEKPLPAKRSRAPPKKLFDDMAPVLKPRAAPFSGNGTPPPVRTFPSGKRVGRPPTKSKLQESFRAPSQTPTFANGESSNARELAPKEEAALHDAAESLVNQTVSGAPAVKRKHPGGRPKKVVAETSNIATPAEPAEDVVPPPPKPKGKGGRPRKHPRPEPVAPQSEDEAEIEQPPKKKRGRRRVKKEPVAHDAPIELGEQNGVLESTEQGDGTAPTSADSSRPTTSSSNATQTTLGSRRSTRAATREKSYALLDIFDEDDDYEVAVTSKSKSKSTSTSSRGKRKRGANDPETVIVDTAPIDSNPTPKKRKARAIKEETPEFIEEAPTATSRGKRKRTNTLPESSIEVADPAEASDYLESSQPPPPAKKRKSIKPKKEVLSEAIVNEDLDPEAAAAAAEALEKAKAKSKKLSDSMKARWSRGGMAEAMEKRKDTNAKKKAERLAKKAAQNAAMGLPVTINSNGNGEKHRDIDADEADEIAARTNNTAPISYPFVPSPDQASITGAPAPALKKPRAKKEKAVAPAPLQTQIQSIAPAPTGFSSFSAASSATPAPTSAPTGTRTSGRVRKPTRAAMGYDGAGDDEDEIEQQFASEYDHFQALTSPKSPMRLGKRQRKSLMDLSALMHSEEEEEF